MQKESEKQHTNRREKACLEKFCRIYGEINWPPYPEKFDASAVPKFIKDKWIYEKFHFDKFRHKIVPKLKMNHGIIEIVKGDTFNAIAVKGRIAPKYRGPHRILQFNKKGYVNHGEVKAGLVYRFEVTSVRDNLFYCRPINHIFNKNNLFDNWTNCYYKKNKKTS